ncbi:MAG: WYL domain-containing protein [Firmicutes bacterium]|nr:WYL domain-containing protein [Bacillota bacterium]
MAGFSELIKNFEKTRDYMRDFFIYGYKVRGDFNYRSVRTYDDEKRRAESWLGECLRYDDSVRGRQISISVDSGHIAENPLYRAYYSKSFTDNDIRLHFFILDVLADNAPLTLKETVQSIDERFGVIFEEQTVRNKLKEYAAEGILICQKRGRADCFSLSPDICTEYFSEIPALTDAVKFFSECGPFGIIGNSILKAADIKNDIFLIKHNYIVHTLEDMMLAELITAADEKRLVSFESYSAKRSDNTAGRAFDAVPLCIFCSVQTGRRYLAAYIPEYRRFHSFRLDRIKNVKPKEAFPEYDSIYEKFLANTKRCFGVSFGSRHEWGYTEPLKITFYIDEKNEEYVLNRLLREKRCGTLEKAAENTYILTLDVFDPNEAMHWAKSFIGRILRIEGGSDEIRRRFYNDIKRMYNIYGDDKIDDIQ